MNAKNTVSMTGAALALAAAGLFASLSTQVVAEEAMALADSLTFAGVFCGLAIVLAECNAAGGKVGE